MEETGAVQEAATTIAPVHPSKLDMIWPAVEPWLLRAMEHGPPLFTTADVLEHCRRGDFVLWIAIQDESPIGMAITSLDVFPQATIASVRWAGGEEGKGRDWLNRMLLVLKAWGKHFGAKFLAGMGRKGWLRGYGFRDGGVIFEMDIST